MRAPRMTPLAAVAALSLLTVAVTSACSSSPATTPSAASKLEKTNLTVGAVPAETSTALYVAQQQGIFAAHDLHVKIESLVTNNDATSLLLNGTLDVSSGQVTTFIAAQAAGAGPFRVLAGGLEMGPGVDEIVAAKGSGISSPPDLVGKTIGENAITGNGVLLTDALLASYNISPNRVAITQVPFQSLAAAFAQHRVQVAYCSEPYCTELQENEGATVVADLNQGPAEGLLIGGYTVTAAWLARYPNTAAAFVASITEASQLANTNIADAQKAFETYL
jgi:ABC-type nitrate/sulfonate/bicarbonate transport system substrate-binding protein